MSVNNQNECSMICSECRNVIKFIDLSEDAIKSIKDQQFDVTARHCSDLLGQSCLEDETNSEFCTCSIWSETDDSSVLDSLSIACSDNTNGGVYDENGISISDIVCCKAVKLDKDDLKVLRSSVQNSSHVDNSSNFYRNVYIRKSKKIHLGNLTVFNGPVYVNPAKSLISEIADIEAKSNSSKDFQETPQIGHTNTEDAYYHSENILLVRVIQQMHIESQCLDDITYNFLIGCDGNIFEGRGWNIAGQHSPGYDKRSLGIAFVGSFNDKLPPPSALRQVEDLINFGIRAGYIDKDYSLIGQCQCIKSDSPGKQLFEKIQHWQKFDSSISINSTNLSLPFLDSI